MLTLVIYRGKSNRGFSSGLLYSLVDGSGKERCESMLSWRVGTKKRGESFRDLVKHSNGEEASLLIAVCVAKGVERETEVNRSFLTLR